MDAGAAAVEAYLATLPADQRQALQRVQRTVLRVAPEARPGISYGMPAYAVGKAKVGFAAFSGHCTFFPFSGTFLEAWWPRLPGFRGTKSGVHFTPGRPIPARVLEAMVRARLQEDGMPAPRTPKRASGATRAKPSKAAGSRAGRRSSKTTAGRTARRKRKAPTASRPTAPSRLS